MDITIQNLNLGNSTCGHRVIQTDRGNFTITLSQIQSADPRGFTELLEAAIIVLKHQYLSRIAAGRTSPQAMSDLRNFVVRV